MEQNPPAGLCAIQAVLMVGTDAMFVVAALALVLELLFETGLLVMPISERVRVRVVSTGSLIWIRITIPVLTTTIVGWPPVRRIYRVCIMGWDRKLNLCYVGYTMTIDGYYKLAASDTDCIQHKKNEVYCSIKYNEL